MIHFKKNWKLLLIIFKVKKLVNIFHFLLIIFFDIKCFIIENYVKRFFKSMININNSILEMIFIFKFNRIK
jgi:hypothetical protein